MTMLLHLSPGLTSLSMCQSTPRQRQRILPIPWAHGWQSLKDVFDAFTAPSRALVAPGTRPVGYMTALNLDGRRPIRLAGWMWLAAGCHGVSEGCALHHVFLFGYSQLRLTPCPRSSTDMY